MKKARILFYDIETQPIRGLVWGLYEQNVVAVEEDWKLLSVAWKWQGEKKIGCLTRFQAKNEKTVAKHLGQLFGQADLIVGHNGDKFDMRKVNAKLLEYKAMPPRPPKTVDTLKETRKNFALSSYKLGDVCQLLGIGEKIDPGGISLWRRCMANEEKAFKELAKYNRHDVFLLEGLYDYIKPWIKNHPSIALIRGIKDGCPTCGSTSCRRKGVRANHRTLQQQWQCKDCHSWFLTPLRAEAV